MVLSIFSFVFAQDDGADAFNALMLKIGVSSMQSDIEDVKKSDENQNYKIEVLQSKIETLEKLLDGEHTSDNERGFLPKLPLEPQEKDDDALKNSKEYQELLSELQMLRESKKSEQKNSTFYVIRSSANVREAPNLNAHIVATLEHNQSVEIENCTIFGWCKLTEDRGYIADFLIGQ